MDVERGRTDKLVRQVNHLRGLTIASYPIMASSLRRELTKTRKIFTFETRLKPEENEKKKANKPN